MALKYLTSIDLNDNEILNTLLQNLATDPTGKEGKVYYNTTTKESRIYSNGAWKSWETTSNKSTDTTMASNSDVLYPSQKAVKAYADGKVSNSALGTSTTVAPSQNAVKTYIDAKTDNNAIGTSTTVSPSHNAVKTFVEGKILNSALGTSTTQAPTQNAVKTYVDTAISNHISDDTDLGGASPSTINAPSVRAVKTYVDSKSQGLNPKTQVRVATTANITLSGLQTIDGITLVAGDRVLVKNQSSADKNGIYVASASTWARATDLDSSDEFYGAYVTVLAGTTNAGTGWVCTVNSTFVIGTHGVEWVKFNDITKQSLVENFTPTAGFSLTESEILISKPFNGIDSELVGISIGSGLSLGESLTVDYSSDDTADISDSGYSDGTSTRVARADHKHIISSLDASKITGGTLALARIPTGTTSTTVALGNHNHDTAYLGINANASSASKWANARTITLGGDLTGNVSIDGSANVTLTATVADNSHAHTTANITGLDTALAGKANSTHSHAISDVTGLQSALDGKASSTHNHSGVYEPVISSKGSAFNASYSPTNMSSYSQPVGGSMPTVGHRFGELNYVARVDHSHEIGSHTHSEYDITNFYLDAGDLVLWKGDSSYLQVNLDSSHSHIASNITQDASNRFVTDTEKSTWNAKARKTAFNVGDASATSFVLTHNFNTRDISVSVAEVASPYSIVYTDVELTSVNTITVKFASAPTLNQYRVTVIG